jgi:hypothetical protein
MFWFVSVPAFKHAFEVPHKANRIGSPLRLPKFILAEILILN